MACYIICHLKINCSYLRGKLYPLFLKYWGKQYIVLHIKDTCIFHKGKFTWGISNVQNKLESDFRFNIAFLHEYLMRTQSGYWIITEPDSNDERYPSILIFIIYETIWKEFISRTGRWGSRIDFISSTLVVQWTIGLGLYSLKTRGGGGIVSSNLVQ